MFRTVRMAKIALLTCILMIITLGPNVADTKDQSFNEQEISIGDIQDNVKVPIIAYHNLMDNYNPQDSLLQISPVEFENHMVALQKAGYHTISFQDYYEYVLHDQLLPDKPVIITFDDGYRSNYEYAYPILRKLQMKATIFVITGRVGVVNNIVYPHFSWEEAREMQNSGVIDIESHSELHPDMSQIDPGRARLELEHSKYLIQKELKKPCDVFAYPFGLYNTTTQMIATQVGYKMQAIVGDKGVNTKSADLKQLRRLTAKGKTTGDELIEMIEKNLDL